LEQQAHLAMKQRMGERDGTGSNRTAITSLQVMAQTAWPTTTKEDGRSSARHGYMLTGNQGTTLLDAARLAHWQTPRGEISGDTAESHETRQARVVAKHGRRMGTPLEVQAAWPTPKGRDWECENERSLAHRDSPDLSKMVVGTTPIGSPAETANRGQLNPAHSRWLMGYPPAWDVCAVTAMPSSRKSRPK